MSNEGAGPSLFGFYSFDTSAFINGRRDIFRAPTFEPLWDRISGLIDLGVIRSVDEVKYEIRKKDDDASKWVKRRNRLFVPLDHDVQRATREVLKVCPRLMAQRGANRNSADPFVIGLALAHGGIVVTQESPAGLKGPTNKPRIPDACKELGVECWSLPEFVDKQGWQLAVS